MDNSDLVRKGDYAEHVLAKRDPDLAAAMDDLAALYEMGDLSGVAEILRERHRQVAELGYTPEHDDTHVHSELVYTAMNWAGSVLHQRADGTADIGSDEEGLRKAGALCAAEIDRAIRSMSGQVQSGERHPELGIHKYQGTDSSGNAVTDYEEVCTDPTKPAPAKVPVPPPSPAPTSS